MPIFDYECLQCQYTKETMVKHYDDKITCSRCESEMLKKIGASTFILKGPGFHGTGSYTKARSEGPSISKEIKEMPDSELCTSLGLDADYLD